MRLQVYTLLCFIMLMNCAPSAPGDFTAWMHPYLIPLDRATKVPELPATDLSVQAAPGEYEPVVVAVRGYKNLSVTVAYEEGSLPLDWVELNRVESLADSTQPNRLYQLDGAVEVDSAETVFFWITVHPPEGIKAGDYTGTVIVSAAGQREELKLQCRVLPFRLADSKITAGAFMCLVDLPEGWYEDMKQHGIDAIQFFTWEWSVRDTTMLTRRGQWAEEPIAITRRGDKMVLDFSAMDRIMERINGAGMEGPIVVSLGNDRFMHYETRIAEVMGLSMDTTVAPTPKGWSSPTITFLGPPMSEQLDSLFISGIRQMHEHWAEKAWPQELVILIYDEPTHGLLERGKQRYDLIKRYYPGTQIYGVVMDKRELAREVAPQCDIIVCNGDFDGCGEVAEEMGKGLYVYGGMGSVNYARFRMGCMPWRARGQGVFFWMYNYWFYSPDGCAVYQHPDDGRSLVRSVNWESIREGVDDLRYFATAEALISELPPEKEEGAAARLENIRNSINVSYRGRPRNADELGRESLLEHYQKPQRVREQVIELILDVLAE